MPERFPDHVTAAMLEAIQVAERFAQPMTEVWRLLGSASSFGRAAEIAEIAAANDACTRALIEPLGAFDEVQCLLREEARRMGPLRDLIDCMTPTSAMVMASEASDATLRAFERVNRAERLSETFAPDWSARIAAGRISVAAAFADAAAQSLATERLMYSLSADRLGTLLAASAQEGLAAHLAEMTDAYRALELRVEREHAGLSLPSIATLYPPAAMFAHVSTLEAVTEAAGNDGAEEGAAALRPQAASEIEAALVYRLQSRPALITMWQGAVQVLATANPERSRHFCASVRELLKRLIDDLAPDGEVEPWGKDTGRLKDNRTHSKLYYIARHVQKEEFGTFVIADTDAVFHLWNFINSAAHATHPRLDDRQLRMLRWRVAGWILSMLEMADLGGN